MAAAKLRVQTASNLRCSPKGPGVPHFVYRINQEALAIRRDESWTMARAGRSRQEAL